ncbi:ABC transporter ATP-binding protein [Devriesea agamarum]|uniref:ABC transporter ATP-binding protein n=1 Tax=Devriesea agamarum TaxID=472569 RepID=UPI00071CDA49|nr:ABC transporter ATP-binding protein [Devriesea agamarum]
MITAHHLIARRGGQLVLGGVDLCAHQSEVIGIVGPNGAGKSTLLQVLYRELSIDSGAIVVDGYDLARMRRHDIARKIAVVAQETDSSIPLSVRHAVGLGRLPSRTLLRYGDQADQALVDAALARVGLTELADRLITELSGGEKQRVMIARAIVQDAGHLLLDEPTNHLDLRHQFGLLQLVRTIGATTIIVLHDLNLAARCCDRIALLHAGQLVADGTPDEVLRPQILEPVYQVRVHRLDHGDRPHLLFDPLDDVPVTPATPMSLERTP